MIELIAAELLHYIYILIALEIPKCQEAATLGIVVRGEEQLFPNIGSITHGSVAWHSLGACS
jgi:hypothetical protein